jgi:hypothetical protein
VSARATASVRVRLLRVCRRVVLPRALSLRVQIALQNQCGGGPIDPTAFAGIRIPAGATRPAAAMITRLRERAGCRGRGQPFIPEDYLYARGGLEALREQLGFAGGFTFAAVETERQADHGLLDVFTREDVCDLADSVFEPVVLDRAQRGCHRDVVVRDCDTRPHTSGIDACATHVAEV